MYSVRVYSRQKEGHTALSPNFKVREFACSDGSDPVFIAPALVELLQALRSHFGRPVTVCSGYRTAAHNAKVGGASASQHLYGAAADITVQGIAPAAVADYAEQWLGQRGGVGRYASFTHVDVRPGKSRWQG